MLQTANQILHLEFQTLPISNPPIRQLTRRLGEAESSVIARIRELSIEQLEGLGEALLDFAEVADLLTWLEQQRQEE